MSRVLVTGGFGFLGVWVARDLVARGATPVLLDVVTGSRFLPPEAGCAAVQGDVLQPEDLARCVAEHGVTRIVHTVFATEPLMGGPSPRAADHLRLSVLGTLNVLEVARRHGCGVVFVSSKAVYGPLRSGRRRDGLPVLREGHPRAPLIPYGSAKLLCEQVLETYRRTWEVDYAVVRFATLYGPGKADRYARYAVHSQMIEAAASGRPYRLQQGGDQLDDMIYVKDAAAGVAALALAPSLGGEDFNLGTGHGQTLRELAGFLKERFPAWSADIGGGSDYFGTGDVGAYCIVDIGKARRAFGYRPRFDLQRAAEDYLTLLSEAGGGA